MTTATKRSSKEHIRAATDISTKTVPFTSASPGAAPSVVGFDELEAGVEVGLRLGCAVGLAEGVAVGCGLVGSGVAPGDGVGCGAALAAKPGVGSKLIQPKPGR